MQGQIEGQYPLKIERFTGNINILLEHEREQKTRYRNALGDLAHSLKTPLAVIQSGLSGVKDKTDGSVQEQISRMNSIVEYQLQRAATAGAASLGKAVNVKLISSRLLESLHKVYREKQRVTVQGINIRKKHQGQIQAQGRTMTPGIIEFEGPIHISNVMLVCPSCGKPTRVGISREDGKAHRICKRCEAVID